MISHYHFFSPSNICVAPYSLLLCTSESNELLGSSSQERAEISPIPRHIDR
jgi:hypothetical protein